MRAGKATASARLLVGQLCIARCVSDNDVAVASPRMKYMECIVHLSALQYNNVYSHLRFAASFDTKRRLVMPCSL